MVLQSMETDEELWRRFLENHDQYAFTSIVKKYRERLLAYLMRLTGDAEESLDLLQETLKRFAQSFKPEKASAKTFMFCIAVNLARSHYRRVKTKRTISLNALEDEGTELSRSGDYYTEELRIRLFQDALNRLDVRDREVIELKDVEGFTYKSAAEIVGCSEKRFEKKLLRARKRLKHAIERNPDYETLLNDLL